MFPLIEMILLPSLELVESSFYVSLNNPSIPACQSYPWAIQSTDGPAGKIQAFSVDTRESISIWDNKQVYLPSPSFKLPVANFLDPQSTLLNLLIALLSV